MNIYGTIHNAKKCTIDGRDFFISAVCHSGGLLYENCSFHGGRTRKVVHCSGHHTFKEALKELRAVKKKREYRDFGIYDERTWPPKVIS